MRDDVATSSCIEGGLKMERVINCSKWAAAGLIAFFLMLSIATNPANAFGAQAQGEVSYDFGAYLYDAENGEYPGVYKTVIAPNEPAAPEAQTIGIPSIADANLETEPTIESPAIICGSALPWYGDGEGQENARKFTQPSENRVAPYSYFKFGIMDQQGLDGTTLKKLSGFDGTYVIVRIDVSKLLQDSNGNPLGSDYYLHVS